MSSYTLELGKISKSIEIFDFDYNFYSDDLNIKKDFEDKFTQEYYYHEIGFETIGRFKNRLRAKLNKIMPYYKQIYKTELEAQNINFLLNKDLKETFERNVEGQSVSKGNVSMNDNFTNNNVESNIGQGNASVSFEDGNVTNASKNTGNNSTSSNNTTNDETNQNEKTVLISQGNIGITSSAELLQKWRDVIINIDEMIIEDCWDLFMQIF